MSGLMDRRGNEEGGAFRFRVSDAVEVPLRGYLLRLRLLEGTPSVTQFRPGRMLRLRAPEGEERWVRILDNAIIGGRATQARLERTRELDVVITKADALRGGRAIGTGWMALGTAAPGEERAA